MERRTSAQRKIPTTAPFDQEELEARHKAEDSEARFREELNRSKTPELPKKLAFTSPAALKFREELIAAREASITPELPVKPPEPLTIEERYRAFPVEGRYQVHINMVHELYAKYALKDITTMSPKEKEDYRVIMDRIRWGRVALESNLPVEQKLAELTVRLATPSRDSFGHPRCQ